MRILGVRALRVLFAAVLLAGLGSTSSAWATNCLQPDGEPFEEGNLVCQKVKNVCDTAVGFKGTVTPHTFGVHGLQAGTPSTGSRAIDPGGTAKFCVKKPTTPGKYCFRILIENADRTQVADYFGKWLNNIVVAVAQGGSKSGMLGIGGSGLLVADVILADESGRTTPGWSLSLTQAYVPAASFPAEVGYTISAPRSAPLGQTVTFVVAAYDADTGERVGDATIRAVAGATVTEADALAVEEPAGDGETLDESDVDASRLEPALEWSEETARERGAPIVGPTVLTVFDTSALGDAQALRATFAIFGPEGPVDLGPMRSRGEVLGVAQAEWDTSSLPPGNYRIVATLFDEQGRMGSVERWARVAKAPVAHAEGFVLGNSLSLDAGASFDPDGGLASYRWELGNGEVLEGSKATIDLDLGTQEVTVDLTVTDLDGNETTSYCLANFDGSTFTCAERSCGCESMSINADPGSAPWTPIPLTPGGATSTNQLGPINEVPVPPTANGSYDLRVAFQVEAKLKPNSDPTKCDYYQWVKRTSSTGGAPSHSTDENGHTYPYSGSSYNDDTPYPEWVNTSDGSIRWVDAPGFGDLSGSTITGSGAGGISRDSAFIAMVTGPLGTCKRCFEVEIKMNNQGQPTTGPKLTETDCR